MKEKGFQNIGHKISKLYLGIIDDFIAKHDVEGLKRFYTNSVYFQKLLDSAHEEFVCMNNVLKRLSKSGDLHAREGTLIIIFLYLLAAEGHICNHLNFVSYLLATRGHDLFSFKKRGYVKDDIEEIRKVEMWIKIQFLNVHGFKALTREYDSTFRNDIAHHNYTIDDKGVLWIKRKQVDLGPKLDAMLKIVDIMNHYQKESLVSLKERVKALRAQAKRANRG